jgi:hypothetical protein
MDAKLRIAQWKERKPRLSPDEIKLVFEGRKAVSLWDMIVILAGEAATVLGGLLGEGISNARNRELTETKAWMRQALSGIEGFCDRMCLDKTKARIAPFRDNMLESCNIETIEAEYEALYYALGNELSERKLVFIPPSFVQFLEQDALFDDAVNQAFPSAQPEIKDAGNCLAVGLPNAAIFHLMRVAELGLRALAKTLNVKMPVQIEFATWGQVIDAIDKKLAQLKGQTPAKSEKAQFYSGLILEIRAFSHLWRNPVMHARSRYDEPQAQSAFNHVRSFMQRLAERVKEGS